MSIQNIDSRETDSLIQEKNRRRRQIVTIEGHGDITNSFLILNGDRSIVVDCGSSVMVTRIVHSIKAHNLKLSDVVLIIITHTHYDHVKGLKELKNKHLPHAKILVHEEEGHNLESGYSKIPPGTGIPADIIMRGEELDLCNEEYGNIPARIIHTPGHSKGSISILVGKVVIAGDTIECDGETRAFPSFAENVPILLESWRRLTKYKIAVLLPGHGVRCPIKLFRSDLKKYEKIYSKEITRFRIKVLRERKIKSKKRKNKRENPVVEEPEEEEEGEQKDDDDDKEEKEEEKREDIV